jgi:hypothetical protein
MDFRAVCLVAILIATCSAFAGLAFAQFSPPMNLPGTRGSNLTQEQQERLDAMDKEYEKKIKQIPDKKAPSDPWGNMREPQPKGSQGQR